VRNIIPRVLATQVFGMSRSIYAYGFCRVQRAARRPGRSPARWPASRVLVSSTATDPFPPQRARARGLSTLFVAGCLVGDDVAIMMVEAEATGDARSISSRAVRRRPTEDSSLASRSAKPFSVASRHRRTGAPTRRRSPIAGPLPSSSSVFLEFADDVLESVHRIGTGRLARALTIVVQATARS